MGADKMTRAYRVLLAAIVLVVGGCVFKTFEAREVAPSAGQVRTPVKAHMHDGSVVVFANGATIDARAVRGVGMRTPLRAAPFAVTEVPLDSVIGVETFTTSTDVAKSGLASAGTLFLAGAAAVGVVVATFGSCPTFYSDSAGTPVLQAEAFSYAIAPIFEHRDNDRLRITTGSDGLVRLEVRNEALETHYINHLELLEVTHDAEQVAITDEHRVPVLLRGLRPVSGARDASGRDVGATIAAEDGDVYSTSPQFMASRSPAALEDHIEFTVQAPGRDSVAVVLRLRNSLLNTVLLYDEMLAASGPRALDWIGQDLARISTALELGEWYTANMGLRVQVGSDSGFNTITRIADVGPIAFHDVVAVVPVPEDGNARVRLSFVADNWRIDRVAYAVEFRRAEARAVSVTDVRGLDGSAESAAFRSLRDPDEDYLVTTPGQAFVVTFDAGAAPISARRTFFLASQGYYSEWMRPEWLRRPATTSAFTPSNDRLYAALTRWSAKRESFEQQFFASKISTR